MINDRHPEIASIILDAIHDESDADGIQALLSSAASVRDAGFTLPSWDDLATGTAEEEGGTTSTQAGVAVAGCSRGEVT